MGTESSSLPLPIETIFMKKILIGIVPFLIIAAVAFRPAVEAPSFTAESKVNDVLFALGDEVPGWFPRDLSEVNIQRGKELILNGRTTDPDGKRSRYVSVYYMCTSCHNNVIEDPVLTVSNPQDRLEYAREHQIPFLQGTTFYGITNRESWYNDDYYKKYGDLVTPASHDLSEAVQLCASECAQGRPLVDWEMEAVLAYFYSISYTLSDLGYTDEDAKRFASAASGDTDHTAVIAEIKSKYALKSPATFEEPPYDIYWDQLNGKGNAENGKLVYELSCQACHKPAGVSDVVFGDNKQDFKAMSRWFDKNNWWLLQVVRHGTHPAPGHKPYMPLYTTERMSNIMVEDLKAYIMQQAGKGS